MNEKSPLHRLFGLSWIDFFQGTAISVETEVDLSFKQQFLDLVLIRKGSEPVLRPLPDGFEELAPFNLVTFKSHQEALDFWALWELVGHFVNFRKQFSPSLEELLPTTDFRLFAVCARFPHNLSQQMTLVPVQEGVYEVQELGLTIRVIVLHQLPLAEHNAMLLLFSAREESLRYGQQHYRPYSRDTSTLLFELFKAYREDSEMSDKLKDFVRKSIDEFLKSLSAEERLKGLPAEERLKGLPAEERLKGLSVEEEIRALSPEALEALVRKLKANGSSAKS